MAIFLPTAHNIQGFLSDELVTDEEAQDRDVEIHTLDGDRQEGDNTISESSLHATDDAYSDEIPPPYPGNSSGTQANQHKKPCDLGSQTSVPRQASASPANAHSLDYRTSSEQQPLFDD